ncbi:MAG TPA: hypothetical protein VK609_11340 [Mucilaginibacter sp.]|nr:hypothetical protein [Mucilaginibacter sp.]
MNNNDFFGVPTDCGPELISLNLIDEYYIFRNPVAIGNGLSPFQ